MFADFNKAIERSAKGSGIRRHFATRRISTDAVVLLTLLGTAGEALGYDWHLKSNTTKRRTRYSAKARCSTNSSRTCQRISYAVSSRRFAEMLVNQPVFVETFGAIKE